MTYFHDIAPIAYAGPQSDKPLTYRWYDKDRVVLGKRMADHLRFAVCYWHSFAWNGFDVFGYENLRFCARDDFDHGAVKPTPLPINPGALAVHFRIPVPRLPRHEVQPHRCATRGGGAHEAAPLAMSR